MPTEKTFYDIFKFGMEFEMETPNTNCDAIESNQNSPQDALILFVHDGSISRKKSDTTTVELISRIPLKTQEEENTFFAEMKTALPDFKSSNGVDIFAHENKSAGTHFHWSFKDAPDEDLWVFDTMAFEKFFFTAYMNEFRSQKFMERINSNYCKAPMLTSAIGIGTRRSDILKNISEFDMDKYIHEYSVVGRYRWLNMKSIVENTGAEIRVFPFIQTHKGAKQVAEFFKKTILEFYLKEETQQTLKLIHFYNAKIAQQEIIYSKLNSQKKMIYALLRTMIDRPIENGQVGGGGVPDNLICGEFRILMAKWVKKQPGLIQQEVTI